MASLCCFQHLFAGLTNRSLRELIAGVIPGYSARQMTLRLWGACAAKGSSRGSLAPSERSDEPGTPTVAVVFTKTYTGWSTRP